MLAQINDRDVGAFAREQGRGRPADSAVGTGDQRDLVLQTVGAFVARPPVGLGLELAFVAWKSVFVKHRFHDFGHALYSFAATPMPSRWKSSVVASSLWSGWRGLAALRNGGGLAFFVTLSGHRLFLPEEQRGLRAVPIFGLRAARFAASKARYYLGKMAGQATQRKTRGGLGALWRFLPMLWPKGEAELKARVVLAVVLVLLGKAAVLVMPFAYKAVIDGMSGRHAPFAIIAGLVAGYATARFAGVLSDNLRNALFEKVGQNAARRLARQVFRHIHDLSLRFHLERRTGSLTKIVERGTKSIDMMLYFLLFNIAPTLIELTAICVIFFVKFGAGPRRRDTRDRCDLHHLHEAGDRLARAAPAPNERCRQQGHRARGRLAPQLRNGQIFRRRGA